MMPCSPLPWPSLALQGALSCLTRPHQVALTHKVNLSHCLTMVKEARALGLTVPVVFMGYYNPFLAYGLDALMKDCVSHGVDGFIIVDLPPEEGQVVSHSPVVCLTGNSQPFSGMAGGTEIPVNDIHALVVPPAPSRTWHTCAGGWGWGLG